jgi:bisphosphoglycerate-independent phosphoglycerate mutase (AlkP superfamily)
MSKYMTFTSAAFRDRECLLNALSECGYSTVEEGDSLSLYGYRGDRRPEMAQIVVRRKFIGSASNDLGFQKTEAGYVPVISEYDQRYMMRGNFLTNLRTNYNLKSAEKLARSLRGTLHKERVGSTIKIRIKY